VIEKYVALTFDSPKSSLRIHFPWKRSSCDVLGLLLETRISVVFLLGFLADWNIKQESCCRTPLTVFPVSTLQVQTLFFFPLCSIQIDVTVSFKVWELGLFCLFLYFNYQLSLGFLIEIACLFDKLSVL